MSTNRHLTQQQRRRIATMQQSKLASRRLAHANGNGNHSDAEEAVEQEAEQETGLVIANLGEQLEIETDTGSISRCFVRENVRQNLGHIVAGDNVAWVRQAGEADCGVIIAVQERKNVLIRPDKHKQRKTVAANVDQMLIVLSVMPEPIDYYIDQYLVAAEITGLHPLLVLNKIDLTVPEVIEHLLERYQKIGYQVVRTSVTQENGLDVLHAAMMDKSNIMVGQSGVGKSSLINGLFGEEVAKTGDVSTATQRGKHTTTTARLYHLPGGGDLIDCPGVREFGLWHLDGAAQVLQGFKEFQPYVGRCQFRNCSHRDEPGCAILQGKEAGVIDAERLRSYYRIVDDLTAKKSDLRC